VGTAAYLIRYQVDLPSAMLQTAQNAAYFSQEENADDEGTDAKTQTYKESTRPT